MTPEGRGRPPVRRRPGRPGPARPSAGGAEPGPQPARGVRPGELRAFPGSGSLPRDRAEAREFDADPAQRGHVLQFDGEIAQSRHVAGQDGRLQDGSDGQGPVTPPRLRRPPLFDDELERRPLQIGAFGDGEVGVAGQPIEPVQRLVDIADIPDPRPRRDRAVVGMLRHVDAPPHKETSEAEPRRSRAAVTGAIGGGRRRKGGKGRRRRRGSAPRPAGNPSMTQTASETTRPGPADRVRRIVALRELAVAPENLRFGEAADDAVPELAATIRAAGVMTPLTVRPGRGRKEAPFMALDGRRRLMALGLLAEAGEIDGGYEVEVFVETDPGRQAAAAVLTNTAAPVHVADVIVAIGRMLKAKLTVEAIAAALGYGEAEIRRLAALSTLPPAAIGALRAGRLTLRQAKLLARLPDRALRTEIARQAADGMGFQEWRVREALEDSRVTVRDPRCVLVGAARYAAAGGRIESDLFAELPDRILDPEILTALWSEQAGRIARLLEADGFAAAVVVGDAWERPDHLERFGCVRAGDLDEATRAAFAAASDAYHQSVEAAKAQPPGSEEALAALAAVCRARAAMEAAGAPGREVGLIMLAPGHETGIEAICLGPPPGEEAPEAAADHGATAGAGPDFPSVDVEGISHGQHRAHTEMATLGLARAIADDPRVALIGLVGRLYDILVLRRHETREDGAALLTAERRRDRVWRGIEALDVEIDRRLGERRAAQEASGLAPLEWIAGLSEVARSELLAELFAVSLDLREERTDRIRLAARAEARVLARFCDADLAAYWTPDEPYLAVHGKAQLVAMLTSMGARTDDAGAAKKTALVARVAAEAAERRWLPEVLRWDHDGPTDEEVVADIQTGPDVAIAA